MLCVLTGMVNPFGHLAETYPLCYEDTPAYQYYPSKERNLEYREGVYVGYRYYDTADVNVCYPFGYSLSYTAFSYKNLEIKENGICFDIENIGERDGEEVAQLYVGCTNGRVFRPEKQLKGFRKVWLKAGEQKCVNIPNPCSLMVMKVMQMCFGH